MAPHHRLYTCFFLFAAALGALLARLPDLQEQLGLTESQLGMTLIGMAVGSLVSLTFSAPLIERIGARATAYVTVLGTACIYAIVTYLPSAPAVFIAMFFAGLLAGALEINLNVEIDRIEAQIDRRIMSRAHGFWSLGFFVTALVAAVLRQAGVSIQMHVTGIAVLVVVVAGYAIYGMTNAPARPQSHEDKPGLIAFPSWALLPLCLISIAAFLTEGAGVDWSTIYMRDVWQVEPLIGGLSLSAFTGCMALARLYIGPFVDRFGPRHVATALLLLSAAGLTLVWLAPSAWAAILGFAMIGAGCSAVYPLAVSAAAQRTDRPAAVNVAALGQVSFVVFFLAPPLLGFVAEYLGIRNSYLFCLPVVAVGLLCVGALPTRGKAPAEPAALEPHP